MDPATLSAAAAAAVTTVQATARIVERRRARRERARIALANELPVGSRITDLGWRGVIVEVGPPQARHHEG